MEERTKLTPAQRTTQFGDPRVHAFDGYDHDDTTKSRWAWNLDSRVLAGCTSGHWGPGKSCVRWLGSAFLNSVLDARPAVVVEL